MALLSQSTLLAWFDFGALPLTQFLHVYDAFHGATDGTLIVGFGTPELRANTNVGAQLKDGPLGRYSYGRYLEMWAGGGPGTLYLDTWADANNLAYYVRAAWTLAIVFRPRSVTGTQTLAGKRRTSGSAPSGFSFRLALVGTSLEGVCTNAANSSVTLTIASAVAINKTYIAYLSKTDGAALNMGIKEVDAGSWGSTGGGTQTIEWSASHDLIVNAQLTNAGTGRENFGDVDYSQACWWYSAIAPATIQAGIENHFGIANPAGGSGGVSRARVVNA